MWNNELRLASREVGASSGFGVGQSSSKLSGKMQIKSRIHLMLAIDLIVLLVGQAGGQFRQTRQQQQQPLALQFLRPVEARGLSGRTWSRSVDSLAKIGGDEHFASRTKIQERMAGGAWQAAARRLGREAADLEAPAPSPASSGVQSKCQKRSLGRVIKSAKSLLTDGLEQYATRANLVLGSSLVAAAVPLVALVLPSAGSASDRQRAPALAADSGLGAWVRRLASSLARGGVQGRVDSVMGWIERSVEHLPNFPRLHPQECVKRSICEAHYEPDKHGPTGFLLRILFPATNLSWSGEAGAGDELEYKVTNKYRHAAGFGLARRLENQNASLPFSSVPGVCREKYEDCVVSLLEVAQNLIDVFLR